MRTTKLREILEGPLLLADERRAGTQGVPRARSFDAHARSAASFAKRDRSRIASNIRDPASPRAQSDSVRGYHPFRHAHRDHAAAGRDDAVHGDGNVDDHLPFGALRDGAAQFERRAQESRL